MKSPLYQQVVLADVGGGDYIASYLLGNCSTTELYP